MEALHTLSPRLLVSVRNVKEAKSALAGGVDIIDIKEPLNGSLGKASNQQIISIAKLVHDDHPQILLSAALGELADYRRTPVRSQAESQRRGDHFNISDLAHENIASELLHFVKLGLANSLQHTGNEETPVWLQELHQIRQEVTPSQYHQSNQEHHSCHSTLISSSKRPAWVAVSYVDYKRCLAPAIQDILDAAIKDCLPILLLDTYIKDGSSLFEWISLDSLIGLKRECHLHNIQLALAGQINHSHIPQLKHITPDIVAVRGTVCDQQNREAEVCEHLVQEFRRAIQN